jgi:hypothetical protein
MRKTLLLSIIYVLFSASAQGAVPNDFDRDGVSDLTRVEVGSDKFLTWKAVLSGNQQVTELGKLGSDGDHLAMGQWTGEGTQIGAVALNASSGVITWSILDSSGARVDKTFGKKGDLIVAGADFNGNGTADGAVVRLVSGKAEWQVWYDMFTPGAPTEPSQFTFGKAGDRVFFARVQAGGPDWIGMMRKGAGRNSAARFKNLVSGDVRQFTRLPGFATTGDRPRPFGVKAPGGEDLLGFHVKKGTGTQLRIFTLAGIEISNVAFEGDGQSVVGDFNDGQAYEVAFQSSGESGVFNPVAGEVRETSNFGGVAVDEINVNALGAPVASTPTGSGGSDEGSSGGSVSSCSRVTSWPGSHVYKTIGSTHFTDIRRNTAGVILKVGAAGPYPNCIQVVDRSGKVLANMGLYAKGAGWAARYYAGIGCGASTPLNGNAIAGRARSSTGSQAVYMNFGSVCYGPIDAAQCIGSQQC